MLFDALEGIRDSDARDITNRINKINANIDSAAAKSKLKIIPLVWRVAAFFILLFACVFVVTQYLNTNDSFQKDIAANESKKTPVISETAEENLIDSTALIRSDVSKDEEVMSIKPTKKMQISKPEKKPVKSKESIQHKMQQNAAVEFDSEIASREEDPEIVFNNSEKDADQMSSSGSSAAEIRRESDAASGVPESAIANIFGQVTDFDTGEPLIGANVHIPGTNITTITNFEGKYKLAVPFTTPHLQFHYVGYESKDFSLQGEDEINISLQSSQFLSEAVTISDSKRIQHTDDGEVSVEPKMGWSELERFIEENIYRYPSPEESTKSYKKSTAPDYSGSVELEFLVTNFGSLKDFKVLQSTCKACEERAIQLLKQSGRWETDPPGQDVKSKITIIF